MNVRYRRELISSGLLICIAWLAWLKMDGVKTPSSQFMAPVSTAHIPSAMVSSTVASNSVQSLPPQQASAGLSKAPSDDEMKQIKKSIDQLKSVFRSIEKSNVKVLDLGNNKQGVRADLLISGITDEQIHQMYAAMTSAIDQFQNSPNADRVMRERSTGLLKEYAFFPAPVRYISLGPHPGSRDSDPLELMIGFAKDEKTAVPDEKGMSSFVDVQVSYDWLHNQEHDRYGYLFEVAEPLPGQTSTQTK